MTTLMLLQRRYAVDPSMSEPGCVIDSAHSDSIAGAKSPIMVTRPSAGGSCCPESSCADTERLTATYRAAAAVSCMPAVASVATAAATAAFELLYVDTLNTPATGSRTALVKSASWETLTQLLLLLLPPLPLLLPPA